MQVSIFGQPIYSPGKIVLLSGDTLNGFIGETGLNNRYEQCLFKNELDESPTTYLPNQIKSYRVENRNYYVAREVELDASEKVLVFCANFVEGEMSLWKYKKLFFLETKTDSLQEVYTRFDRNELTREEQLLFGKKRFAWIQYVTDRKATCSAIKDFPEEPRRKSYKEDELIDFVLAYNTCQKVESKLNIGNVPVSTFKFGVAAAVTYNAVSFSDREISQIPFLAGKNINTLAWEVSIPILIRPTRNLSSFSFVLEPSLGRISFSSEFTEVPRFDADLVNTEFNMSWLQLGLAGSIRYTLPNIKPQIAWQVGGRFDFLFDQEVSFFRDLIWNVNDIRYINRIQNDVFDLADIQTGLITQLSVGDTFKQRDNRWEIAIAYHFGRGITESDEPPADLIFDIESTTHTIILKTSYFW